MLSLNSLGQQTSGSHHTMTNLEQSLLENHRHVRIPTSGKPAQLVDGSTDQKANLGALLAKYLQQARRGIPFSHFLLQAFFGFKETPFQNSIHEYNKCGISNTSGRH